MRRLAASSINRRLTLTIIVTTALSLCTACLAFVVYDVVSLRQAMVRDTATLAQVIGINSAVALQFNDPVAAEETLGALSGARNVLGAAIYERSGEVFAVYEAGHGRSPFWAPDVEPASHRFRGPHLHLFHKISVDGEAVGTIYLRLATAELTTRIGHYVQIVLGLLAAVAFVALVISARLRRQISNPLSELVDGSEAIADGDLSTRVDVSSRDEIGALASTFNSMAAGLRNLISQVRQSIGDVTAVSQTLEESGASLAQAAQRQEAAISETADSIESVGGSIQEVSHHAERLADAAQDTSRSILQMDTSIGEIADHMEQLAEAIETTSTSVRELAPNISQVVQGMETLTSATDGTAKRLQQLRVSVVEVRANAEESHALSHDASLEAAKGTTAVGETIAAMEEISDSFQRLQATVSRLSEKSGSIDAILQVIDDVAEQTNLLALNATIIAAQAGEHGKPFSVVADRVRSLSDRTARSTREIAKLIEAVQDETASAVEAVAEGSGKVERGVQRSNEAGDVLQRIIEKSEASTGRTREIAEATSCQTEDLEDVDRAMVEVREIVAQIERSTHEQQRATMEIAQAAEYIRTLGQNVSRSTVEQRRESTLITGSVAKVTEMIHHIVEAVQAQRRGSETIQMALQVFREVTQETSHRADEINEMVATLLDRSRQLEREIGRFKTE